MKIKNVYMAIKQQKSHVWGLLVLWLFFPFTMPIVFIVCDSEVQWAQTPLSIPEILMTRIVK